MSSVADRFLHVLSSITWVRRLQRRSRFPGLGVAVSANLRIDGALEYGRGCSFGEGANILVPGGASLRFGDGCYVGRYVELGPAGSISIGTQTSIQDRSILVGDVTVGRYCLISLNVLISSGRHYYDLKPSWLIQDQDAHAAQGDADLAARHSRPVVVEDDCWIGVNSVIMPGVTVGKGAVIGAGSVVTKDVPPYTVVAGAPAQVVKRRLDFVPPRRISHDNERDWPYFYRGFDLSQAALGDNARHGGAAVRDEFVICLDAAAASELHIVAKSLAGPGELTVEGQRQPVASDFREIVFRRAHGATREPWLHFRVTPAAATVIVKEAWVQ